MITLAGLAAALLTAQAPAEIRMLPAEPTDSALGADLTVYLLTFDPGEIVWERFGHNALLIRDNRSGRDVAFDYGRFDFGRTFGDQLRFVGRFARGLMDYSMGAGSGDAYFRAYTAADRSIWSQELDLPAAARGRLQRFLLWNMREENRVYRYNYYTDNCSTRIRDALDAVIGGQLQAWADTIRTDMSYRDHTRRTTENDPFMYTALMLGLGRPTDRPITAWKAMFLPIELRPYLDRLVVTDPDGRVHPLVRESRHVVENDRFSVAERPHDWTGGYLAVGGLLGMALGLLGVLGRRGSGWRLAFGSAAAAWAFFAGVGGLLLAFLWALTDHRFSYGNENVLQLNVISLLLAFVLPSALWRSRTRLPLATRLAAAVVIVSAAGLLLNLIGGVQSNRDMIAFLLPIHTGLLLGLKAIGAGTVSGP
ncbi:MAG: DUF4105 domain-containing protein, partial [Gemmatimonadales bacterium]